MDSLFLSILLFLVAFVLFVLPGYGWVSGLHRRDGFPWTVRWALGFAWSFAVFGLVGRPFLWYRRSTQEFLGAISGTWIVFAVTGGIGYFRYRRARVTAEPGKPTSLVPVALGEPTVATAPAARAGVILLLVYIAFLASAGMAWVRYIHFLATLGRGRIVATTSGVGGFMVVLAALLLAGAWMAYHFRRIGSPWIRLEAHDEEAPPRLWTGAAVGLILLQAASAVVYDRPDLDDAVYFAAVLDYEHAQALNEQEPSYREGLPVPPFYRTLCWELWGAVLCRLSGLGPMVVFRTLLPGLLVLLAYTSYAALLRELLPRRWVPLALVGLSAFHLVGISEHLTAANHFLPRIWQGKCVLLHIAVPLIVVLSIRFMTRPSLRVWLSLVACILFALAVNLSAIFMIGVLLVCLAPALCWTCSLRTERLRGLVGLALALVPVLASGVAMKLALAATGDLRGAAPASVSTWGQVAILEYAHHGCSEIIWLLALPLLAALLGLPRSGYLVLFPCVLGLSFANPFLFDWVARSLTSHVTYYRLLWLFPVGPGLGALLALSARFLTRALPVTFPGVHVAMPLGLTVVGTAIACLLPGIYVWGPNNTFNGALEAPHLAANIEKTPAGLLPLARAMAQDPEFQDGAGEPPRILCSEAVASFLTSFSRNFRFVQIRMSAATFTVVGRDQESLDRYLLAIVFQSGRLPDERNRAFWETLNRQFDPERLAAARAACSTEQLQYIGGLLQRYRVKYVVIGPGDDPKDVFERCGYRLVSRQGAFTLWRRPRSVPAAGAAGPTVPAPVERGAGTDP